MRITAAGIVFAVLCCLVHVPTTRRRENLDSFQGNDYYLHMVEKAMRTAVGNHWCMLNIMGGTLIGACPAPGKASRNSSIH